MTALFETHPAAVAVRASPAPEGSRCVPARPDASAADAAGRDRQPPSRAVRIRRARDRAGSAQRIEAELAAGLPRRSGPRGCARAATPARWQPGTAAPHRQRPPGASRMPGAWAGKVPAVVVDRRYVVHGEPDVARRIGTHRITSEGTAMNRLLSASSRRARRGHRFGAAWRRSRALR